MKISTALPFLILAAAFGPPAHASLRNRFPDPEAESFHDCCLYYNRGKLPCEMMTDYFPEPSRCPVPSVIFKTKEGNGFCADPNSETVKHCMKVLDSVNKQERVSVEKKLQ